MSEPAHPPNGQSSDVSPAPSAPLPPIPPVAPPPRPPLVNQDYGAYDIVADTVGFVPSRNIGDAKFQGIVILLCLVIGGLVGYIGWKLPGVWVGILSGLVGGTFLSGIILMVRGWKRTAKKM